MATDSLRGRLAEAIARRRNLWAIRTDVIVDADEYETCHAMADAALAVVADWLRDQAQEVTANWPEDFDIAVAAALHDLAATLDPTPEG